MASAKSRFGCENDPPLRNKFCSPTPPSAKIFAAAKTPLGTRVPFRSIGTPFRSCEMAAKSPKCEISNFRSHSPISQGVSQLRNTSLAHECHSQHSNSISQLRNGLRNVLRKGPSSAKMPFCCEISPPLRKLNTREDPKTEQPSIFSLSPEPRPREPPPISAGPPWQEPEELSPPLRQAARELRHRPLSKAPLPSLRDHRSSHLQLRAHNESSEPEEPSSEPQPPQPPQPPPTDSQIPSGMTPEMIIKRPMLTQPPIEGNLDCRARPFHSELCFDVAAFKLQPQLRDSFHLLRRYRMEQLLTPRDFFYPRVAMDFYQSMTTHHVREPTLIHFTIDGRHGILGVRHIAEALRIPYEPTRPEDYRVWTNPSPSDIVRILSRGASTGQYLQRKELPPSMFFIDALLRHNIFPLQHWVQRRGVLLEALYRISEGFFFWPSSSHYGRPSIF
ncbi:hypothetical protein CK203_091341 [Vitis vinifera]|uniref:Uncharacterized protein n=1 Tax=Vitis vinifera TaxID=29760 RepID=A0A438CLH1_VITVI|nr:hypothetical protein CK203_091341 [Vitis vinifera]